MNRFKVKSFLKEFPFINELLPEDFDPFNLNSITIKRVDENLLLKFPTKGDWDGCMGSSDEYENVSFVLEGGTIVKDCVAQKGQSGSNYAHSTTYYYDGESILDAIDRVENPDEIQYIVIFKHDYSNWEGSPYRNDNYIIIYKVPRDKKFSEYLTEAQAKANAEVSSESNF
jgi:hypothetical protein